MKQSVTLLLFFFVIAAHGQENPERQKNRPLDASRDKMKGLEFWKMADANKDQKISKEEFLQLPRISPLPAEKQDKLYAHLDKNQNGTLEAHELMPPGGPAKPDAEGPGEMKRHSLPRIADMDLDGDKKIRYEEFVKGAMISKLPEERRKKIFENMDRNQDGVLSPEDGPPPGQGPRRPDGKADPKRNDSPEGRPQRPPGGPTAPNSERGYEFIDANQDKFIDFAELQKSPMASRMTEDAAEDFFESIDTNKDLKIDKQEWLQRAEKGMAPADRTKERTPKPAPSSEEKEEMMMEEGI